MKLYLDTSEKICELRLDEKTYFVPADKSLAENIFTFIQEKLDLDHKTWTDISEIAFFSGPGSFTGLRIGAAVVNALADSLGIPLYDQNGERHQVIIPQYGRPANISAPRK